MYLLMVDTFWSFLYMLYWYSVTPVPFWSLAASVLAGLATKPPTLPGSTTPTASAKPCARVASSGAGRRDIAGRCSWRMAAGAHTTRRSPQMGQESDMLVLDFKIRCMPRLNRLKCLRFETYFTKSIDKYDQVWILIARQAQWGGMCCTQYGHYFFTAHVLHESDKYNMITKKTLAFYGTYFGHIFR